MERYKNFVRVEQMKENIRAGKFEEALKLADLLEPAKVRNSSDLRLMADLYLENGLFAEAKACLLELYSRKKTRTNLMQLINLSIRLKRPQEAERYFQEFKSMAPGDFYNYIFRYNIDKLLGKPYDKLIATLEKLKEAEYIDSWAYELAKMYHKAGLKNKCIEECNDIEVWFGDGEYVDRARALKAYYDGNLELDVAYSPAHNVTEQADKAGRDETDDSEEAEYVDFTDEDFADEDFGEANSGKEPENSCDEDMSPEDVFETSEVSDVGDEDKAASKGAAAAVTEETIEITDEMMEITSGEAEEDSDLRTYDGLPNRDKSGTEADGFAERNDDAAADELPASDDAVSETVNASPAGALSDKEDEGSGDSSEDEEIDEVEAMLEKLLAEELALAEAEAFHTAGVKTAEDGATAEAEVAAESGTDAEKGEIAAESGTAAEAEVAENSEEAPIAEDGADAENGEIAAESGTAAEITEEASVTEDGADAENGEIAKESETEAEITEEASVTENEAVETGTASEAETATKPEIVGNTKEASAADNEADAESGNAVEAGKTDRTEAEPVGNAKTGAASKVHPQREDEEYEYTFEELRDALDEEPLPVPSTEGLDERDALIMKLLQEEQDSLATVVTEMTENTGEADPAEKQAVSEPKTPAVPAKPVRVLHAYKGLRESVVPKDGFLDRFLKSKGTQLVDYFGFYAYQRDVRNQLIKTMEIMLNPQIKSLTLVLTGERNCGMTGLIKGVTKLLTQSGLLSGKRVAFTDAEKVNEMKLVEKLDKLSGCCMVIKQAGGLKGAAAAQLLELHENYPGKLGVIVTDYRSEMNRLFKEHRELNSVFPQRIHIHDFDYDDLEDLLFFRLEENGYEIDEGAFTVVSGELKKLLKNQREGVLAEADKYIGEIIDKVETRNAQKLLGSSMDALKNDTDKLITKEYV